MWPQILEELEGLHLSAAEQLEGLYEARLALEKERLRQLAAAKDDIELSLKVRLHEELDQGVVPAAPDTHVPLTLMVCILTACTQEQLWQLAAAKGDLQIGMWNGAGAAHLSAGAVTRCYTDCRPLCMRWVCLQEEMQRRATAAAKELAEVHAMYQ